MRRNLRVRFGDVKLRRLATTASAAAVLGGCRLPTFGAPDAASAQGERTLSLWQGTVVAAIAVGVVVYGLIVFTVIRFRRRDDTVPGQHGHNIPLEIVYTAVPVLIVAALFGFNVFTQERVTALVDDPDVRVEVRGFQWQWQFVYEDEDVVVTGVLDDRLPELVLPVDRTTRLELVAEDVIHSFWVPDFLTKRDLIPGVDNAIDVTPTRTGTYDGRCAEFCGLDHWRMSFTVRVVTADEFEAWLEANR
jgi:cytochrome c oxidase subunit 2